MVQCAFGTDNCQSFARELSARFGYRCCPEDQQIGYFSCVGNSVAETIVNVHVTNTGRGAPRAIKGRTTTETQPQSSEQDRRDMVRRSMGTSAVGRAGAGRSAATATAGATAGAVAGPAALVSIPAGWAGEYGGGKLADRLDLGENSGSRMAVKAGTGGASAVTGGAGVGLCIAGPPGAACGAVVAGVGYGASKAVEAALWVSDGADGTIRVCNGSSKVICVCSYNERNVMQMIASSQIILLPGQSDVITANKGALTFGAKCEFFHIHIYEGDEESQQTLRTSGYGYKVYPGESYDWRGTRLFEM